MKKTITSLVYVVGGIYVVLDLISILKTIGLTGSGVGGLTIALLVVGLIFDIILVVGLVSALNRIEDLEDEINSLRRNNNNSKVNDLEYDFKDFKCEVNKKIKELSDEINTTKKSRK